MITMAWQPTPKTPTINTNTIRNKSPATYLISRIKSLFVRINGDLYGTTALKYHAD